MSESPPNETAERPFGASRRRRVAAGAVLFVALSVGLWALAPWILPLYIAEGPMLQDADQTAVSVVWWTSRPANTAFQWADSTIETAIPEVEASDRRHRVRVSGLSPGQSLPFRIVSGATTLAEGVLRSNPAPGAPFRFIVFGDSGKATQAQYLLAQQMVREKPDLALHVGDVVYNRGERSAYPACFFRPYAELLASTCFWPSLGNHDVAKPDFGAPYREVFELPENGPPGLIPETNYWFDYGSARFVILDSNLAEKDMDDAVLPWLPNALHRPDAEWKFVIMHHPPYTGGKYKPDARIQRTLVPLFEHAGVDIVFTGHDHNYQRMHALRGGQVVPDGQGVFYVITGAGGARLYEVLPPEQRPAYVAAANDLIHTFTLVEIDGRKLHLRQRTAAGETLDDWSYEKPPAPQSAPYADGSAR